MKSYVYWMKKLWDYNFFVFDFDGVIADTVQIKTQAFAELYRPYGEEVVSKVVRHHTTHGGVDRFRKIKLYHEDYLNQQLSDLQVKELAKKFASLVVENVVKSEFINGALEFIKMLESKKKQIFVISATPDEEIKKIIRRKGIASFFSEIKGAPPEKAKNLKSILDKFGIAACDCVYFGDSKEDLASAEACGVTFIPINYFDQALGYKDFTQLMEDENA